MSIEKFKQGAAKLDEFRKGGAERVVNGIATAREIFKDIDERNAK